MAARGTPCIGTAAGTTPTAQKHHPSGIPQHSHLARPQAPYRAAPTAHARRPSALTSAATPLRAFRTTQARSTSNGINRVQKVQALVSLQTEGGKPGPGNPQAELAAALVEAILAQQRNLVSSAVEAASSTAERIWKLPQPLPAGLPSGPPSDAAGDLITDPLGFLERTARQYGRAVGLKIAGEPVVLVSDPDLAKDVFITQSDVFIKAGTAFFPGSSLAGNGLLVSDGEVWRRQRRLSNPAFRKSAIASYSTAMVGRTQEMAANQWPICGVRDVYSDFNDLTLDITIEALFGGMRRGSGSGAGAGGPPEDSGALLAEVGPAISTAFTFFSRRATTMFAIPEWFPTPDNIQYNLAVSRLDRLIYRLISDRRKTLSEISVAGAATSAWVAPSEEQGDLLTQLLLARDEDGSDMDDVALRDELMTLLVAGQETSAILLAWTCTLLATNPWAQWQLQQELESVLEGQTPGHADVARLPYLEAVIWETLRLMPPAYLVGRCNCQDATLGPWRLPKGTTVLLSPYLMHRDPQFWPRAVEFDPSRWMPGGDASPHAVNDNFWPFGGGPRNCIGMGFAMMEASLVIAILLQRYSLSLPPNRPAPRSRALITLRPQGEVNLLVTRR